MKYFIYWPIFLIILLCSISFVAGQGLDSLSKPDVTQTPTQLDSPSDSISPSQPLDVRMNVSAKNEIYDASGIDDRRPRRTTLFNIDGGANNDELNLNWQINMSTEDLSAKQAVDRMSFEAELRKLGKLKFGDLYPKYSEYGLNSISVRGLDAAIHSGLFRFQFTTGFNQRASEGDTNFFIDGIYMRYLAAGMLSIGSDSGFMGHISITKVKDKNESINFPGNTKPQESLIGSFNYSLNLFSGKLIWTGETNIANHTRNTGSEIYKDEIKLFGLPIFRTRLSSRISMAYLTAFDLRLTDISIAAKYRRVNPGYTSLGTIRTDNDYEEFSIDSRYSIFQRIISARSSVSYREDNLDGSKMTTAGLLKFLQSAYFRIQRNFNFSLSYSFFLDKDGNSTDSLTYLRNGMTQSFSFSPMITFGTSSFFNHLYGLIALNVLKNGEGSNAKMNYDNYNFLLSYVCFIGNNFSSSITNSHTRMLQPDEKININSTELTLEPSFFQQKLRTKVRTYFSYTTGKAEPERHWELAFVLDYDFNFNETLSLNLHQTWNNSIASDGFSEFRWWLNYKRNIL